MLWRYSEPEIPRGKKIVLRRPQMAWFLFSQNLLGLSRDGLLSFYLPWGIFYLVDQRVHRLFQNEAAAGK